MSLEANKELVRRLHAIWSTGDLSPLEEVYASGFVAHFPPSSELPERHGLEGVRRGVARIRAAFPDWREDVEALVAEGDFVACRYTSRGTHEGEFWGVAPTHRTVSVVEISIFRIAGGRVVEQWCTLDELGRLQQIGALPARPQQRGGGAAS
jgi:predicted ester cyclase